MTSQLQAAEPPSDDVYQLPLLPVLHKKSHVLLFQWREFLSQNPPELLVPTLQFP